MKWVYNVADVKLSTTKGEGWGLTTLESMACGIPNIVPRFSALGEWANGGVEYIELSDIPDFSIRGVNTLSFIPDKTSTITALEKLYNSKAYRTELGQRGYSLVTQPKFEWINIAKEFDKVFRAIQRTELLEDE